MHCDGISASSGLVTSRPVLPNFFIIGAARSGTTSLYHYLGQHPDVFMSPVKEPRYFAMDGVRAATESSGEELVWSGTITSREEYEALFLGVKDETAVGEASVLYLWSERAAEAIRNQVPEAKLIVSLRNPVDRAFSNFRHNRRLGFEANDSFEAALADDAVRHYSAYVENGMYAFLLGRYFARFRRDQISVQLYDDLCIDSAAVVRRLLRFLGVDDRVALRTEEVANASAREPDRDENVDPAIRARLAKVYRDELMRLEELIDRDLGRWMA